MPKINKNDVKGDQLFVRMTRRLADRVRKMASRDGLMVSEFLRLAALERLNRVEGRQAHREDN